MKCLLVHLEQIIYDLRDFALVMSECNDFMNTARLQLHRRPPPCRPNGRYLMI